MTMLDAHHYWQDRTGKNRTQVGATVHQKLANVLVEPPEAENLGCSNGYDLQQHHAEVAPGVDHGTVNDAGHEQRFARHQLGSSQQPQC